MNKFKNKKAEDETEEIQRYIYTVRSICYDSHISPYPKLQIKNGILKICVSEEKKKKEKEKRRSVLPKRTVLTLV